MATKTISCSWVGSGTSSYSQFTSTIHINKNYRACASFSMSGIPAGSTVTSMRVTMVRSSNLYTSSQSISFAASTSKAWSYTSQGSGSATLSQSSGNTYTGSLSASLGNTMLSMGSGYLHLSSGASDDIIYSSISISVTYTEPATTYTVTYKPGSYASGSTYTATKTAGTALTLRGSTYTRSGYTQTGWSTSSTGASKTYNLSASYTTDAAITLYPYWTKNAATTYVVRYEPGDHIQGDSYSARKTEGVALTLRGKTYSRSGYIQAGWSRLSDGSTKNYDLGGSYTTNGPMTLYPYWESTTVAVTGVSLSKTSISLVENDTTTIYAIVSPSNATNLNVNWTSSDTAVAIVSPSSAGSYANVTVTAVGPGTCTLTATSAYSSSYKATCSITVLPKGTLYYPQNGTYHKFIAYYPIDGVWHRCYFYYGANDEWIQNE